MGGDARIRLFCGLQLPGDAVDCLTAWQAGHLRGGRIVPPGNLHVTLAFLGSRAPGEVPAIVRELRAATAGAQPAELRPLRYRETRGAGMIVLEDVGGFGAELAATLGERLERLGVYRRAARPWLPHVTVLRFRTPAGLAPPLPNRCSILAVRTALYRSILRPAGAEYQVVEQAALGGR